MAKKDHHSNKKPSIDELLLVKTQALEISGMLDISELAAWNIVKSLIKQNRFDDAVKFVRAFKSNLQPS